MQEKDNSVTWTVKRRAKAGKEADLEQWLASVGKDAANFKGNLGQNFLRPNAGKSREYIVIVHFDSHKNLEAWIRSDTRAEWIKKLDGIVEGEFEENTVEGMEFWFDVGNAEEAPPKWKMALIIFIVLAPLAILFASIGRMLMPDVHQHLRQLIVLFWTVMVMTYIVMPPVTHLMSPWLNKR